MSKFSSAIPIHLDSKRPQRLAVGFCLCHNVSYSQTPKIAHAPALAVLAWRMPRRVRLTESLEGQTP